MFLATAKMSVLSVKGTTLLPQLIPKQLFLGCTTLCIIIWNFTKF